MHLHLAHSRLCAAGAPRASVLLNPLMLETVACVSQTAAASASFSLCHAFHFILLAACLLLRRYVLSINVKYIIRGEVASSCSPRFMYCLNRASNGSSSVLLLLGTLLQPRKRCHFQILLILKVRLASPSYKTAGLLQDVRSGDLLLILHIPSQQLGAVMYAQCLVQQEPHQNL